ncbi:MAG: DUF998 domain-containing protein [Acidimicrobiaceae bacterium]|nr:DUF998 domain-containing protein [Acidimicrobiaceae bacterium]
MGVHVTAYWGARRQLLATLGLVGIVVYVAIDILLAFLDPRYSLVVNAESDYGVGPNAWLMDANFLLRCAFSLAIAAAIWLASPPGRRPRSGLVLLGVWALASGLLAFLPDNPVGSPATTSGSLHLLVASMAFLTLAAGVLLLSRRSSLDAWAGSTARILRPLAALVVVSVALVLILAAVPRLGFGIGERVFLTAALAWLAAAAWAVRDLPLPSVGRP